MKTLAKLLLILLLVLHIIPFITEKSKDVPVLVKVAKDYKKEEVPTKKKIHYGIVSYYGEYWNGRTTANMEIYNCDSLTCASPTLKFNTLVRVTNIENNKSIIVRVNDRGPYKMDKKGKALKPLIPHPTRILDLSKESFKSIGELEKGLLNVKYEIVG